MTVDTRKVRRRPLHFDRLDEALADARTLASGPIEATGNRSPEDLIAHLAQSIEVAIEGLDPATLPLPARIAGKLFGNLIGRTFARRPMRPGFNAGPVMEAVFYADDPGELHAAVERYAAAIRRLHQSESLPHHPLFGTMTAEKTEQIHCRHAELHLSFLHPA